MVRTERTAIQNPGWLSIPSHPGFFVVSGASAGYSARTRLLRMDALSEMRPMCRVIHAEKMRMTRHMAHF
jgi:hypothetical protein